MAIMGIISRPDAAEPSLTREPFTRTFVPSKEIVASLYQKVLEYQLERTARLVSEIEKWAKVIKDTGATNLREALQYSAGIQLQSQNDFAGNGFSQYQNPGGVNNPEMQTGNKTDTVFVIRGFTSANALRDGFRRKVDAGAPRLDHLTRLQRFPPAGERLAILRDHLDAEAAHHVAVRDQVADPVRLLLWIVHDPASRSLSVPRSASRARHGRRRRIAARSAGSA